MSARSTVSLHPFNAALERVLALLADPPAAPVTPNGYLDLLGEAPSGADTPTQRLMTSRLLPLVYEHVWRPIGVSILGGALGPGCGLEERLTRELLHLRAADRVLDVACGPGNITRRLRAMAGADALVIGIDASPTMLSRAVRDTTAENVGYVRGDAQHLPFRDLAFDAVCCYAALYLMDDPDAAIGEMVRVLAPGGRLAVLTSVHRGPALLRPLAGLLIAPSGLKLFAADEITGVLSADGLTDVHQRVAGFAQLVAARKPCD